MGVASVKDAAGNPALEWRTGFAEASPGDELITTYVDLRDRLPTPSADEGTRGDVGAAD